MLPLTFLSDITLTKNDTETTTRVMVIPVVEI
jgi:hypothetical protein